MADLQYPISYTEEEVPLWLTFRSFPYTGLAVTRGLSTSLAKTLNMEFDYVRLNMPKEFVASDRSQYSLADNALLSLFIL